MQIERIIRTLLKCEIPYEIDYENCEIIILGKSIAYINFVTGRLYERDKYWSATEISLSDHKIYQNIQTRLCYERRLKSEKLQKIKNKIVIEKIKQQGGANYE